MKTLKVTLVSLALAAGFITPVLHADANMPAAAHGDPHENADKKLRGVDKVAEELGLSAEQKDKFEAIRKEEIAALKTVKEDQSLERAARITKNREIRDSFNARRRTLLNPDQLAKFEAALKADKSPAPAKDKE